MDRVAVAEEGEEAVVAVRGRAYCDSLSKGNWYLVSVFDRLQRLKEGYRVNLSGSKIIVYVIKFVKEIIMPQVKVRSIFLKSLIIVIFVLIFSTRVGKVAAQNHCYLHPGDHSVTSTILCHDGRCGDGSSYDYFVCDGLPLADDRPRNYCGQPTVTQSGCSDTTQTYNSELTQNLANIQDATGFRAPRPNEEDYWCTTTQIDNCQDSYGVMWIGDGGEWCVDVYSGVDGCHVRPDIVPFCSWHVDNPDDSRDETNLDWDCTPDYEQPSATFSGSCDPATNDSNQHIFTISNISGGDGNVEDIILFLSFSNSTANNVVKNYLGIPSWENPDGQWFGYYLGSKSDLGEVESVAFDAINNNSTIYNHQDDSGPDRNWENLADFLENKAGVANSGIPADYKLKVDASIKMGGVDKLNSIGQVNVPLRRYTCTDAPAPMCHDIDMKSVNGGSIADPQPGDEVYFICDGQMGGAVVTDLPEGYSYQFKIIEAGGNTVPLTADGNQSDTYTIPAEGYGKYFAQCAVCDADNNCDWEIIDGDG